MMSLVVWIESRCARICVLSAALIGGLGQCLASIELFEIDPEASAITLQASTGSTPWQEQASGSLTTTYHGWLVADRQASSLSFIIGSRIVASQLNPWQPGSHGSSNPESAAYGGRATIGSGLSSVHQVAAIRNLAWDLSSAPIPSDGGQFDSSGLSLVITPTQDCALDYRASGLLVLAGRRLLGGQGGVNAPGLATVSLFAEVQSLILPIDVALPEITIAGDQTRLRFTGKIVARRGIMIVKPELLSIMSPANPSEVTLIWSSPYKLQRTPTLGPFDWTEFATDAPARIPLDGASGFFRVVAGQ